ncbi:MAG: tRNA (adenosine(37)-N6)-threonylcarbamoyltransferase complex transferase subunit TsaD [Candidatus Portnoybacteria bacterium CG10_big_fil_rev_8_21_14_0_10_36_7]|uniref:tRNA N6-adenosine threonylcarbamoyltransferase n=1 Tax=Candidatus Portnoybacteria bacterium CG10_big_fil_rev_8_21_14_0_10_36_7 TaxID=1974812 RepID=A0A2M8KDJ0_9BACT|nr:MAG: tRNA (adenosine(37)-N6)-threonylcarbamoyltransferase complex transferase subunit TsaD [Candidatus Portnoybacteria bacterium CG10_big_fil_rev_8_21_14_0_10_36_7]
MKILAIETSCDDTGIAILDIDDKGFSILTNLISSQIAIHAPWGGVVPSLAKREHQKSLVPLLTEAFEQSNLINKSKVSISSDKVSTLDNILERETELYPQLLDFISKYATPDIDAIAVTQGPGLEPALWVGVNFARALAFAWGKPLIAVSHLEGHVFASLAKKIQTQGFNLDIFPAINLLVSGGHTQLILIKNFADYELLGETLDDAAGESFDKVAKLLGLPYPGGPEISKLAKLGNPHAFDFPRPMLQHKNYEFSFSGLKTAVLYTIKKILKITDSIKQDISASFENSAIEVLVKKTIRTTDEFNVKTVMISGGVAANEKLRLDLAKALKEKNAEIEFLSPDQNLCTDNALMIALVGYLKYKNGKLSNWQTLEAKANLGI